MKVSLSDKIIATVMIFNSKIIANKKDCRLHGDFVRLSDYFEVQNSRPATGSGGSWWVSEYPCDLPACWPGFMWLVIPCTESPAADTAVAEQDLGDQSPDSRFVRPLADAGAPEMQEYGQVQMDEVCTAAAWE